MIYEIVNPSDGATIEANNGVLAALAIVVLSEGMYGLRDEKGETVMPILAFGGKDYFTQWLKNNEIDDDKLDEFYAKNGEEMAAILESVIYGDCKDRAVVSSTAEDMTPEARVAFYAKWNDKKRSSMNDISKACFGLAKQFRGLSKKSKK